MNNLVKKCTYSPEDNKLRIYVVESDERFDETVKSQLKDTGFHWAPIQKLYYAVWSPGREDLCVELGGEIVAEQTTMLERAETKSERLVNLAEKRAHESDAFGRAASALRDKLASGQPVLSGHHSQRKMEKQRDAAERSEALAGKLKATANYWLSRAEGVELHAIKKNHVRTRLSRIDTLFKELRDLQAKINHGHSVVKLWTEIAEMTEEDKRAKYAVFWSGNYLSGTRRTKKAAPANLFYALDRNEITADEAIEKAISWGEALSGDINVYRSINHVLNRLSYEVSALGSVTRFEGTMTESVIKAFARQHGADSPICIRGEDGAFTLSTKVPLPLHIADGETLTLSDDEWRDLFEEVGYAVPAPKSKLPSIINVNCESVEVVLFGRAQQLPISAMTNEEYKAVYSEQRGVKPTTCGGYRVRICLDPKSSPDWMKRKWVVAFITDSKESPIPDSVSFVVKSESAE